MPAIDRTYRLHDVSAAIRQSRTGAPPHVRDSGGWLRRRGFRLNRLVTCRRSTGNSRPRQQSVVQLSVARWRREARRTSGWAGLLYVLPALTLLLLFELWPIAFSVWISLWKWDVGPIAFVGLENYRRLF